MSTAVVTEDVFRIDLAMTQAGGDRGKAAAMLSMPRRQLNQRLAKTQQLRERWCRKERGMTAAVVIDREPLKFRERSFRRVPTDEEIEAAVRREDGKFKDGLAGLNLAPQEMEMAMALQKFQHRHFRKAADLIGGGISMAALKLLGLMETLGTRLKGGQFTGENKVEEEKMCWESYLGICAELRKMGHFVSDAGFKKALIELRAQEVKKYGPERGRPGFGLLQKTELHVHQGAEDRSQRSEVKGQRSEGRGQRSEGRGQATGVVEIAGNGGRGAEGGRGQRAEVREELEKLAGQE